MSTNLIQNSIVRPSAQPVQQKKPAPDFDIQRELNNRTFIKPLKGKGKLVNETIFNYPNLMVKGVKYKINALKHAVKGDANDHELGKINDVGLAAGGLAIAGYLFTKKQTPLTKGMEFVGLGSFLASMAIWPKIAIQLPAYLVHGVNVHKKYEDSFGRQKPFYQDPQFIPWDLYSDKEIHKIGDRLGVPRNIPNRREAIQEKMRKIAVQNNTMWMLTAGFATPIMSALICNQAEPYLAKYLNNIQNKKADKILTNLDEAAKKYDDKAILKRLNVIAELYRERPLDSKLKGLIVESFAQNMDPVTADSIRADLNEILDTKHYVIDQDTAKAVSDSITKKLVEAGIEPKVIEEIVPNQEAMVKFFESRGLYKQQASKADSLLAKRMILQEITRKTQSYLAGNQDDFLRDIPSLIVDKNGADGVDVILKELNAVTSGKLSGNLIANLRHYANIFDDFRAKNMALDEFACIKVGAAPETVVANYWNDVSQSLLKTFGFTPDEIARVSIDRNLFGTLLRDKIELIVSDEASYTRVLSELSQKIASINEKIPSNKRFLSNLQSNAQNPTSYEKKVDSVFDKFAELIKLPPKGSNGFVGFERTAKAVIGLNGDNVGTYKNIQKAYLSDRLLGVNSAFCRLINALDMFRRISTNPDIQNGLNGLPREIKEELVELCKIITLQGHSSDYATKFYMHRNPYPDLSDFGKLEINGGKVVNKYFGKAGGMSDIPNDKYFYQNAMKLMFDGEMHPDTLRVLEKSILGDEIKAFRNLSIDKLGGEYYFVKPRHLIRAQNTTSSDFKFLLTGIAPDELFYKAGQQAFNTNKWLKIFGGIGAGLLGITVLSQFFFGRTKTPQGNQK